MRDLSTAEEYRRRIAAEGEKWGAHLEVEASGERNSWLDHPLILRHYRELALIDGRTWEQWVLERLGGPAEQSLELGCGAGGRSLSLYRQGATRLVDGFDISRERLAEGEARREAAQAPGRFMAGDVNRLELPEGRYDLIFSSHSFHHFLELEQIMREVNRALTPRGLFVLEEYVGPSQFQWTAQQMDLVRSLLALLPAERRVYRHGLLKALEGRPLPAEVEAVSPFESIRSGEILALFERTFEVVVRRSLGGTLQHLLYNGIIHNFEDDGQAERQIRSIQSLEDTLIEAGLLPSDFMLLIGSRRETPLPLAPPRPVAVSRHESPPLTGSPPVPPRRFCAGLAWLQRRVGGRRHLFALARRLRKGVSTTSGQR